MFSRISVIAIALLLAGCASESSVPTSQSIQASAQGHAECLVCKHNADLACVDVTVTAATPCYDYNGRRYYFCSNECRDEFAKNPHKYAP